MLEIPQNKVAGNDKVLEGLYKHIERARKGQVRAIGIIVCEHLGAEAEYWGDENARAQINTGCDFLKYAILNSVVKIQPTDINYSIAAYDLGVHPVCYDIIQWLATTEMLRRANNAVGPLKVCFVKRENSMVQLTEERMKFFENVMRPALKLFGAVEDVAAANGRFVDFVGNRDAALMFAKGAKVPMLQVPEAAMNIVAEFLREVSRDKSQWLEYKNPVTITLRETSYYEYRNSNLPEWVKLAKWLIQRGENVVIVRDTAAAAIDINGKQIDGLQAYRMASENLYVRAALYSQAKCNLFVQNGPWALAQFTDVPWLCFATLADDCVEDCNRPEWWGKFMGLNTDRQIAWATPQQRIVYAKDTFPNMKAAYESLEYLK